MLDLVLGPPAKVISNVQEADRSQSLAVLCLVKQTSVAMAFM